MTVALMVETRVEKMEKMKVLNMAANLVLKTDELMASMLVVKWVEPTVERKAVTMAET